MVLVPAAHKVPLVQLARSVQQVIKVVVVQPAHKAEPGLLALQVPLAVADQLAQLALLAVKDQLVQQVILAVKGQLGI